MQVSTSSCRAKGEINLTHLGGCFFMRTREVAVRSERWTLQKVVQMFNENHEALRSADAEIPNLSPGDIQAIEDQDIRSHETIEAGRQKSEQIAFRAGRETGERRGKLLSKSRRLRRAAETRGATEYFDVLARAYQAAVTPDRFPRALIVAKAQTVSAFGCRAAVEDRRKTWLIGLLASGARKSTPHGDERHQHLVAKLEDHINRAKATGSSGYKSKTAFCKAIRIHPSDFFRWQRSERLRAPGHAQLIEGKIESL